MTPIDHISECGPTGSYSTISGEMNSAVPHNTHTGFSGRISCASPKSIILIRCDVRDRHMMFSGCTGKTPNYKQNALANLNYKYLGSSVIQDDKSTKKMKARIIQANTELWAARNYYTQRLLHISFLNNKIKISHIISKNKILAPLIISIICIMTVRDTDFPTSSSNIIEIASYEVPWQIKWRALLPLCAVFMWYV